MPMPVLDFPLLNFEQANPALEGARRGIELQQNLTNYLRDKMAMQYDPQALQEKMAQMRYKTISDKLSAQLMRPEAAIRAMEAQEKANELNLKLKYPGYGMPGVMGQVGGQLMLEDLAQGNIPTQGQSDIFPQLLQSILTGQEPTDIYAQSQMDNTPTQYQQPELQETPQGRYALPSKEILSNALQAQLTGQQSERPITAEGNKYAKALQTFKTMQENEREKEESLINYRKAATDLREKAAKGWEWAQAPADEKRDEISRVKAMGYSGSDARTLLAQGASIDDLAAAKGLTPAEVRKLKPAYAATQRDISVQHARETAEAEAVQLVSDIKDLVGPYMGKMVMGYSPSQLSEAADVFLGKGDEISKIIKRIPKESAQARFVAGMIMAPETSSIFYRLMQGQQMGVEAMRDMTEKQMMKIRTIPGLTINPKIWMKAQDIALNRLVRAQRKATEALGTIKTYEEEEQFNKILEEAIGSEDLGLSGEEEPYQEEIQHQENQKIKMMTKDGRIAYVRPERIDEAIKTGARRI